MNKTLGKITTIFFFLLFFILAPLFVFYAKGYRFNTDTRSVEKNGAFYIKSYPDDAEILINDTKTDKKTPTQLTDIKPDVHKITVSKESYVNWEKELSVYSGETTFAEDVVLFLSNRPKETLDNGSDNYISNKYFDKYVYIDSANELYISNVEESINILLTTFDEVFELLEWSYDNEKILLADEKFYYTFDINRRELSKINITKKEKVLWDNRDSNIIWFLEDAQLYKYNFSDPSNLPELQNVKNKTFAINDFGIWEDNIVIQYSKDKNQFVSQVKKSDLSEILLLDNMNYGKIEILLANDDNLIFILGSNLHIKNKDRDLLSMPVTKAKIHDDRILITNGHEILLYNFKEDWQELIDRSSQIVSDILWHPNGSYFLSEIDGQTKITEIDGRDKRNSINIYQDYLKKLYLFNKKGDKLFILSPEENFYLTIQ